MVVALVLLETVLGIPDCELLHQAVTAHLGEDGGRGDTGAARVSVDHGAAGHGDLAVLVSVDEGQVRLNVQTGDGAVHGEEGGPEDVELLDLLHRGEGHGPGHGLLLDQGKKKLPLFFGELLRVVQTGELHIGRENHRGGTDRSREGAAAGLVHAADAVIALGAEAGFKFHEREHRVPPEMRMVQSEGGDSRLRRPSLPAWYSVRRVLAMRSISGSPREMSMPRFRAVRSSRSQPLRPGSGSSL